MYAVGLRASEAIGLHARDLDPGRRALLVPGSRERVVPVGRRARTAVCAFGHADPATTRRYRQHVVGA